MSVKPENVLLDAPFYSLHEVGVFEVLRQRISNLWQQLRFQRPTGLQLVQVGFIWSTCKQC